MAPAPRGLAPPPSSWSDLDDDDGWQDHESMNRGRGRIGSLLRLACFRLLPLAVARLSPALTSDMPVVRSNDFTSEFDAIDDKRYGYRPERLDDGEDKTQSNATGQHLELGVDTLASESWREKGNSIDESDYTRLRLEEDEESEEVHMRTRYLFDDNQAMTPLSQMQATKDLLTEGQRIAYVGLCQLIMGRMIKDMSRGWEGYKMKQRNLLKGKARETDVPVVESGKIWMIKIMARLFQHMDVEREGELAEATSTDSTEQHMIESLQEHGVDPADLVPALMTTHTVKNPDYDPEARRQRDIEEAEEAERQAVARKEAEEEEARKAEENHDDMRSESDDIAHDPAPPYAEVDPSPSTPPTVPPNLFSSSGNPFDDGDMGDMGDIGDIGGSPGDAPPPPPPKEDAGDIGGDIGRSSLDSPAPPEKAPPSPDVNKTPKLSSGEMLSPDLSKTPKSGGVSDEGTPRGVHTQLPGDAKLPGDVQAVEPLKQGTEHMPSLPGVSTTMSTADENITLDIRWTVLCDLFLVLVADSLYDARSRAFLERVANALGFGWMDIVRFENRVTEALELEESVGQLEQDDVIDSRAKTAKRKRYALMGLAAVGGGLVIGLSAGLLAPVIGAGLGAALGTIGITGTTGFLAGAGGAAIITTTGVVTGANIAGRGMARRTREVRTFEFKPLHNNKRVSCYITVGGFMASKVDDVRLPFSVLDSAVGDVFSVLWEPEMMSEMGGALKIIGTEVLTQVSQQVLQATIMTALMSALQWPLLLTKLGYLIDNPWANALDRSRAAGLVLADALIARHAGIRPTSLIGFSLGSRVIFYALLELHRQKAYGIVQDVYIFGSTVTANRQTWLEARSVVAGRFVNGYATNDWVLGYLFRATTGGLNTVAGLRPVEMVPGLENLDVTDCITGHMSYRSSMPQLLIKAGFPCTSDEFDEPDVSLLEFTGSRTDNQDPEVDMSVNERITEEEEEARRKKKILGIFPRRKKKTKRRGSDDSGSTMSGTASGRVSSTYNDIDEDDMLPPREEHPADNTGGNTGAGSEEPEEADLGERPSQADIEAAEAAAAAEKEAISRIPATAGFDFAAISRELGKEVDPDKPVGATSPRPVPAVRLPSPLNRTGSAPPPLPPTPDEQPTPPAPQRSNSAFDGRDSSALGLPVDDDGDIAITAQKLSVQDAWDRPAWPESSPNLAASPARAPSPPPKGLFGFNAWASSTSPSGSHSPLPPSGSYDMDGKLMAPPARPHPAEFTNPFASSGMGALGPSPIGEPAHAAGWNKRAADDEKMALENPW
ncbi:integral membrane protein [Trichosporon asahii var. asahii CBS 2479]|uniref:Integral membrane protein n=1 Tax=Trichosporon asahii var. asahii (strain ATCC 90039 / CBS 2479 / JCM 2466 / KCTC 7840 / NBRC 103889/ NCYC 2677 / UAMH 7654) TaxID=1186058 RepID=J5SMC3_TRIAS|nr:integral membrane protein [Trichosporon asahii var. asahii CBS 2479]EJT46431.1 integral membrane protein [Trichosporon asahii var. asahii CBS 2479]